MVLERADRVTDVVEQRGALEELALSEVVDRPRRVEEIERKLGHVPGVRRVVLEPGREREHAGSSLGSSAVACVRVRQRLDAGDADGRVRGVQLVELVLACGSHAYVFELAPGDDRPAPGS